MQTEKRGILKINLASLILFCTCKFLKQWENGKAVLRNKVMTQNYICSEVVIKTIDFAREMKMFQTYSFLKVAHGKHYAKQLICVTSFHRHIFIIMQVFSDI